MPLLAGRITRRYASPLPRATAADWQSDGDVPAPCAVRRSTQPLNRRPHRPNRGFGFPKHDRSINAHHVIAEPPKPLIPPRVRAELVHVSAAIHFHHQAQSRGEKVSDVPPAHRHLPAEHHPETATGELPPKASFR